MSFTAKDLLSRAQSILNDGNSIRWPLTDLVRWVNDGLREIVAVAPDQVGEVGYIKMVAGTKQPIPVNMVQILEVIANVEGTPATVDGVLTLGTVTARRRSISAVRRQVLDVSEPSWGDTSVSPAQNLVVHYVDDSTLRDSFYVAPAQVGGAWIEVVAAFKPKEITTPSSPLDLNSYGMVVDLDDRYQNALLDYVLSKAFQKDIGVPASEQRAQLYYQGFLSGLGIRQKSAATATPGAGG